MIGIRVNYELVRRFEAELDPRHPEESSTPTKVLGYGEMSTTLEIGRGDDTHLAYKRMPMFESEEEAILYETVYWDYVQVLQDQIGLQVVSSDLFRLPGAESGRWIVYLVQEKLPSEAIGNKVIRRATAEQAKHLTQALLRQIAKAFEFNRCNEDGLEIGLDGQISNWAVLNFSTGNADWQHDLEFVYFDTGSPLLRRDGQEQLSPELYLRSAPSFLAWFLRLFFLEDVVTRYYDFRSVAIDLLANLYKEQRPDLVPPLVKAVNEFFSAQSNQDDFKPITEKEVRSYYRTDAWIWRLYLAFRRVDRRLHHLLGKHYPYVLPGKTRR